MLANTMPLLLRSGIATPTLSSIALNAFIGDAKALFRAIRRYPTAHLYVLTQIMMLPTEEARRIRTHKAFPKFADEIGLVKGWQTYGWPDMAQPNPGTDGSDLQFTVS